MNSINNLSFLQGCTLSEILEGEQFVLDGVVFTLIHHGKDEESLCAIGSVADRLFQKDLKHVSISKSIWVENPLNESLLLSRSQKKELYHHQFYTKVSEQNKIFKRWHKTASILIILTLLGYLVNYYLPTIIGHISVVVCLIVLCISMIAPYWYTKDSLIQKK